MAELPRPEDISTENEIFTLEDVKEAFMYLRSCNSMETLVKAIAAGLVRARAEGRVKGLQEASKVCRDRAMYFSPHVLFALDETADAIDALIVKEKA